MTDWCPDLSRSAAPRYLALADSIEEDIASGVLKTGDRLPAQRRLAVQLGLDFTTVARGYNEARRRGVISSLVGSGTFVSGDKNMLPIGALSQNPTRYSCSRFFHEPAAGAGCSLTFKRRCSKAWPLSLPIFLPSCAIRRLRAQSKT
jgi:DNA-binding transcriptional regulator YhcF (GntR family)